MPRLHPGRTTTCRRRTKSWPFRWVPPSPTALKLTTMPHQVPPRRPWRTCTPASSSTYPMRSSKAPTEFSSSWNRVRRHSYIHTCLHVSRSFRSTQYSHILLYCLIMIISLLVLRGPSRRRGRRPRAARHAQDPALQEPPCLFQGYVQVLAPP